MSYTKQTWDTTSYVNPTRMNHIEDGIKENSDNINSPAFTEAATRTNINSGESLFTILGKIKKFFTDLKAVAFSGSASDVDYSNSQSGLSATKVQGAIDEVAGELNENASIVIYTDGVFVTRTKHTVCWSIEKTPTSIAHGTILATGLPAPMITIYTSVSMANGQSLPAIIETNGTMSVYYPTTQTVARIDASGSYHTNS